MRKNKNAKFLLNKNIIIFFLIEIIILFNIKVAYIENLNSQNLYEVFSDNNQIFIFENRIKEEFEMKKRANLNEIESNLPFGKKWEKNRLRYNEINVGSSLDHNFVLETIVTTTSIIEFKFSNMKINYLSIF